MSEALSGKVVLVTGGAKRVGAAIARRLHREGANLMLHYRGSEREARALRAELNVARTDSVALVQADLLDIAGLSEIVRNTLGRFDRLDALVNNASTFFPTPVGEMTQATWDSLMGANLRPPLFLPQSAPPHLTPPPAAPPTTPPIHPVHPRAAVAGGPGREARVPARRPGDRRLRHDPRGRSRHGVPLGRQGQLRAARCAPEAARALAGFVRPHRRQPRSTPPGVSRPRPARLPRVAGRSPSDRGAGHLFGVECRRPGSRNDVRPFLASAPRRPRSLGG